LCIFAEKKIFQAYVNAKTQNNTGNNTNKEDQQNNNY
jgi:hypothetical protein